VAQTKVKIAKPGGIVWDPTQPKHTVLVEGQDYPVELTPTIGRKLAEGTIVEVKDAPTEKDQDLDKLEMLFRVLKEHGIQLQADGNPKMDPGLWPDRATLKSLTVPVLRAWAKAQELTFHPQLGEEKLLDLIDEHRPKS
jgi:hypothetical protein